jgi:hypothetical protein
MTPAPTTITSAARAIDQSPFARRRRPVTTDLANGIVTLGLLG